LLVVEALADPEVDRGMGAPIRADDRGQQGRRDRGKDRDRQFAPVALSRELGEAYGAVGLGQRAPRLLEYSSPGRTQHDPSAGAVEQPDAEGTFQVADLARKRRLGDAQAVGGAAVVEFVGHRGERPPQSRIHIHAPARTPRPPSGS